MAFLIKNFYTLNHLRNSVEIAYFISLFGFYF